MLKQYLAVIRGKWMAALLLVLWMGVIFLFSSLPGAPVRYELPITVYIERKGAHVFEFFLLALFLWNAFSAFFPQERRGFLLRIAAIALFYAILDETHQLFVAGRDGKFTDILYDGSGILIALAVIIVLTRKKETNQ